MNRLSAYIIILLSASLLSIIPAAIWPDFTSPVTKWDNWLGQGQATARQEFSLENMPRALRVEVVIFKVCVYPPTWAWSLLGGSVTAYGLVFNEHASSEASVFLPPFALMLEHIQVALPFWLMLFAMTYEGTRYVRECRNKPRK